MLNENTFLYRGVKGHPQIFLTNPKIEKRTSVGIANYYTLIMSNDPKWKEYPPRDSSIILATNQHTAEGFGDPYIVFPYDNANFGIVQKEDIWSIWGNKLGLGFNMEIKDFLRIIYYNLLNDSKDKNYGKDYSLFKARCDEFDKIFIKLQEKVLSFELEGLATTKNCLEFIMSRSDARPTEFILRDVDKEEFEYFLKNYYSQRTDTVAEIFINYGYMRYPPEKGLYRTLSDMFSPDSNFYPTSNIEAVIPKSKLEEVWTDSKCLLIDQKIFNENENFKLNKILGI
jgi:hypothetical protein